VSVIRRAIGEGTVLKQDQSGLGFRTISTPAERRLTCGQVVGLTRIVLQNLAQTIVHAVSGGSTDIGPGAGIEQDRNEMIAS
jgi:hypothetical protein